MRTLTTASLLAAAALASACSNGPERYSFPVANDDHLMPAVSPEEAGDIARTALEGYNSARYDLWSTRWAESLRAGIPEPAFLSGRQQLIDQVGQFQAIRDVRLTAAKAPDHVRYAFRCAFERGEKVLIDVYPTNGTEIVGAFVRDDDAQ